MTILTIRTDNPQAEVGLYDNQIQLASHTWQAHRQLAETIHATIAELLRAQGKDWSDIAGVVAYQGPGSFTGLRIGLSVANAIASANGSPIVATTGETWTTDGLELLTQGKAGTVVVPEYGAPVHITTPKK